MADLRSHPEQDEEHDGATPQELLIEACRRNNTDLLQEVIEGCANPEKVAVLLNETKTVMGNYLYHEAALAGNYEVIDMLLDQEGFECDPVSRMEGDTPLHSAVRYVNQLPRNAKTEEYAKELIGMMCEAGSDPRIKNKAHLTPAQLVDPSITSIRQQLLDAIEINQNQGDYIVPASDLANAEEELDDDYAGSASDSDFDPEEYKREKERRKKEMENVNGGVA